MSVDTRPHDLAGCRRRHGTEGPLAGKPCYPDCPCRCHRQRDSIDYTPPSDPIGKIITSPNEPWPVRTPAWVRGIERARAELAKQPADDGTVTVSVPDRAKVEREHFKLCRTCSQVPERCRCG